MSARTLHKAHEIVSKHLDDRGWTPEELARRINQRGLAEDDKRLRISYSTIYRFLRTGRLPIIRVRFAIAQELDLNVTDIWPPNSRRGQSANYEELV